MRASVEDELPEIRAEEDVDVTRHVYVLAGYASESWKDVGNRTIYAKKCICRFIRRRTSESLVIISM